MKTPIIILHGAPGCGKTTVGAKLHEILKCPWFEFGWIPEFQHLNPHTTMSYELESQMTFETLALVANNYIAHGFSCVLLSDIEDHFIPHIPDYYTDYQIITLYSNDDALIKERIITRDNGNENRDYEAAIALNQTIKSRELYSFEKRICVDNSTLNEIADKILEIVETNEERQARIYPIILSEYNPAWREWFAEEKENLERLIGKDNIAAIYHYGSTSVPGLSAKPTVNILLEIKESVDIEKFIALMSNEYICLRREGNSLSEHDLVMFLKGYLSGGFADKVYHIHVRNPSDWDELYFRDYLISHPEAAAEYADLKRSLFKDYEHNRDGYTAAKGAFIKKITEKAKAL